jgi:hypothetical protein
MLEEAKALWAVVPLMMMMMYNITCFDLSYILLLLGTVLWGCFLFWHTSSQSLILQLSCHIHTKFCLTFFSLG